MSLLNEQEYGHNYKDKKKEQDAEYRQSSEPEKVHPTVEFVIVAKSGSHVLRLGLQMWSGRKAD